MGQNKIEREPSDRPLSVLELNDSARRLLEASMGAISVQGEIGRVTHHGSGHVYFTLKDADASIAAVMWARTARTLNLRLTEGLEVVIHGNLTLWAPAGRYQLIVRTVTLAGEGAQRQAFLNLKARLEKEGLTDPERKRALPFLPRAVGVVTSPTGAALKDIVRSIRDRFPSMPILVAGARVQGMDAADEIARAVRRLDARDDIDVLVVGRGGGSAEDLNCFNDEILARVLAKTQHPVVSAVGHEIDITIADLVADVRALTPTAAGELVVPNFYDLTQKLDLYEERLKRGVLRTGKEERRRLDALAKRPGLRMFPKEFQDLRRDLRDLLGRGERAVLSEAAKAASDLKELGQSLKASSPSAWVRERRLEVLAEGAKLQSATRQVLAESAAELNAARAQLQALNPLAVLQRGFTITRVEAADGKRSLLRAGEQVAKGQRIVTTFAQGPDVAAVVEGESPRDLSEGPERS